mgnify:CR=1 FL=1
MACAAAVATLELFAREKLFERAGEMGRVLGDAFHSTFRGLPNVIGIRSLGCAAAVELAPLAGLPGKRAYDIFVDCFKRGALVRPAGEKGRVPGVTVVPQPAATRVALVLERVKFHEWPGISSISGPLREAASGDAPRGRH